VKAWLRVGTRAFVAIYAAVSRRFRSVPWPVRLVFAVASCGLVVASLGIDQPATSAGAARHLGFGYPLHFVSSDFTSVYTPPSYPSSFRLNPWEVPIQGNLGAFVIDWAMVYTAIIGSFLLLRVSLTRAVAFTR